MGCLNSGTGFSHWFSNIHLSGPCNRSCFFCIGQHMMALDPNNNLKEWPLVGIEKFVEELLVRNINEVNLTGTNTDPSLYEHHQELRAYLDSRIPNLRMGLRTNGVALERIRKIAPLYDKASVSVPSFDPDIYRAGMGNGAPPDVGALLGLFNDLKVNIILGPHIDLVDLSITLENLWKLGVKRVNLREPYGQSHVGDPMVKYGMTPIRTVLGMPEYTYYGMKVLYWDVHYVAVESVNLYAQGRISIDYPITRGHDETGIVLDQSHFTNGRHTEQWQKAI